VSVRCYSNSAVPCNVAVQCCSIGPGIWLTVLVPPSFTCARPFLRSIILLKNDAYYLGYCSKSVNIFMILSTEYDKVVYNAEESAKKCISKILSLIQVSQIAAELY